MSRILNKKDCSDIIIAGAGLAGVSAAIAAARRGARVALVEKESVPGGTVAGLRHQFLCGLFVNSVGAPRKYLNRRLTEEVCRHLSSREDSIKMGKVWLLPYDPDRLVIVLKDLLDHERNIQVFYGSKITSCSLKAGRIQSVRYSRLGKSCQLKANAFIDAGAGILLEKCKAAKPLDSGKRQMSGFTFELAGVPWDGALSIRVPYVLYKAVQRQELPLYARWTVVSACEQKGSVHLKLSLPVGTSFLLGKKVSQAIIKILSRELPAFRSAKIVWQSRDVFFRDGVRLDGQYVLKDKDVLSGKKFSDGVVKGAWPMEFWDYKLGPKYNYLNAEYYEIPVRSLIARNVFNLFAAGRSVSAEPGAQASLRAGGLCLATGEAAGNAAVDYLQNKQGFIL